jgi:muramoyltetrapeptide carboxypeptidase
MSPREPSIDVDDTPSNYGVDSRASTVESEAVSFVVPPPLRPGDVVAVVAPSSPFDVAELDRGVAALRARYAVRVRADIAARAAYLAGDDDRRAAELADAMRDPSVRAIACARGGYGAMRVLDRLPWDELARAPKWIVGFSDITALHVEANRRFVATMHAAHVTGLGRDEAAVLPWTLALEQPHERRVWSGLRVLAKGEAEGAIVGGNLALVHAMAAAGRVAVPDGAILALEDVTERPYRIDRMLTALRLSGVLARCAGVVLGGFTQCEPGADGRTADEVVGEFVSKLAIPVLADAPFGHGDRNEPFVLGARAKIAGDSLEWSCR